VKSADNLTKNIHQKLKEAASQTARRNKLLGSLHNDILLSDWSYVRVLSLPMLFSYEIWEKEQSPQLIVCGNCRQFILDRNQLNHLGGWLRWLQKQTQQVNIKVDDEYRNLLTRIIGFLLVSDCEPPFSKFHKLPLCERMQESRALNEEAVSGKTGSGAGVTSEYPGRADVDVFKESAEEGHSVQQNVTKKGKAVKQSKKDKKKIWPSHLGSLRTVVLWNRSQVSVLLSGKKKLILDADFGCGKTLLLKSFALHLAKSWEGQPCSEYAFDEKVNIVFLSVSAARTQVTCFQSLFLFQNLSR
jgi:hypothetical protein